MPDTVPAIGGRLLAHPLRSGFRTFLPVVMLAAPSAAQAQDTPSGTPSLNDMVVAAQHLERHDLIALVLTLGVLFFAVAASILLMRARRDAAARQSIARDEIMTLKAEIDRANALLLSERQLLVSWQPGSDEPDIQGDTSIIADAAMPRRILAFGTWLDADEARRMDHAVAALRAQGEAFSMALTTTSGSPVEAEGRVVGGHAVLRLRSVAGVRLDLMELSNRYLRLTADIEAMQTLVESLPSPVWMRDDAGRLVFANTAYARAVEAPDGMNATERGLELFDRAARIDLAEAQAAGQSFERRLPAVVAGQRRSFDVLVVPTAHGTAGIGVDATEAEAMRAEVLRLAEAHRRTLDHLATAVAMFGADQRLIFYNAAYRSLWDLDAGFLDQGPTDSAVLDRLRSARKLPEQTNFRQWKAELHDAYRNPDSATHEWHLPDGRTLRIVTTPNTEGGVTYLFEDVTERIALARRYDALIRVQGETLDHLAEAVAVFGSDGRLRLSNPSFIRMWKLPLQKIAERPHIETVIGWSRPLYPNDAIWQALHTTITAIDDRRPVAGRLERRDGSVVDCATVPLPDGATLVTFVDVTDSVNVERALRERNEALETADEIKVDFVHHVSYELRSPLTNIIGFAELLEAPAMGDLTPKQREYLGYITSSTTALLALINNILDLATIDAGAMTLNLGEVDIRGAMESAAEGIGDRLAKDDIRLDIRTSANIGTFVADERRLRQVLFNLLSNAVGFSPPGGAVTFVAERRPDAIIFSVADRGSGIPNDVQEKVFDWFETHSPLGSRHRGTGLGLSLVRSFVELHGGSVVLDSKVGEGTTVTCIFPLERADARTAAE